MGFQYKQLGQVTPGTNSPTLLYELPSSSYYAWIRQIHACNNSGNGNTTCRVFLDQDNNTADETTALLWDVPVNDGGPMVLLEGAALPLLDLNGALQVRTASAGDVTFTAFGMEYFPQDLDNGKIPFEFGQVRPSVGGTAVNVTGAAGLNPIPAGYQGVITDIIVTNTHATDNTFLVVKYNAAAQTFALDTTAYVDELIKGTFFHYRGQLVGVNQTGALAVECPLANAATFSIYGYLEPKRYI